MRIWTKQHNRLLGVGLLFGFISFVNTFLYGCATIASSIEGPEELKIDTEPKKSSVRIIGYGSCTAPCKLTVSPERDIEIIISAKGYEDLSYTQTSRLNLWLLGDLFFGVAGIIVGGLTDYYTHSIWTIDDDVLYFVLDPIDEKKSVKDEKGQEKNKIPDKINKKLTQPHEPSGGAKPLESEAPNTPSSDSIKRPPPPAAPQLSIGEKKRLTETYPESEVASRIKEYHGNLSPEDLAALQSRIYTIISVMEKQGEKPDIDEAIRQDLFNNLGHKSRQRD